jgi:hypothetical protein
MKRDSCKVEEFKIDKEVNDKSNDFLILNDDKVYFKDIKKVNIKTYLKWNKEITESEHENEITIITKNKKYQYTAFETNKEMYTNYINLLVKIKKYKIDSKQERIMGNKTSKKKKSMLPIYILIASPVVIGIIALIIYLNTPNYYEENQKAKNNIEKEQLKINRERCSNQSDTYHKCKWSILENRCICKQR